MIQTLASTRMSSSRREGGVSLHVLHKEIENEQWIDRFRCTLSMKPLEGEGISLSWDTKLAHAHATAKDTPHPQLRHNDNAKPAFRPTLPRSLRAPQVSPFSSRLVPIPSYLAIAPVR